MIAVIDYRVGNLGSVRRAIERLGFPCRVTGETEEILSAERVIFPGVGAAGKAMECLRETGLDEAVRESLRREKPILGICLGAQIILEKSEENGASCLGLIKGKAVRFPEPLHNTGEGLLKVPHIGWNGVIPRRRHPVLEGIRAADEFYFVHSYYPLPEDEEGVIALTDYGVRFPSVIGCRNLVAVQFHPEKSGAAGLRLLRNFCTWDGRHAE